MSDDVLPDSRLLSSRVAVSGTHPYADGKINWVQVFCANCGTPYGYVPEQNCSFACWLCTPCAEKWGTQFGDSLVPDEVFWKRVQAEMLDKYGRILTDAEIQDAAQASCNPLSILLREEK
jgi:hypothetical protein